MTNKRRMNDEYNHAHWKIFDHVKLYVWVFFEGVVCVWVRNKKFNNKMDIEQNINETVNVIFFL